MQWAAHHTRCLHEAGGGSPVSRQETATRRSRRRSRHVPRPGGARRGARSRTVSVLTAVRGARRRTVSVPTVRGIGAGCHDSRRTPAVRVIIITSLAHSFLPLLLFAASCVLDMPFDRKRRVLTVKHILSQASPCRPPPLLSRAPSQGHALATATFRMPRLLQ